MVENLGELRKIASAYSKSKTFVFVEELISGKIHYYNGYILGIKTHMLIFYDIRLKKEFPILLETIKLLTPSRMEEEKE